MNCNYLQLLKPTANLFYLKYYESEILNHFYKELYLDNIHTRKVKWSYIWDLFFWSKITCLSLKSMQVINQKNMSKHSTWLVAEYRTKLCYIALVSAPSCEVGYNNCRNLSSLFLVWSKNPSMHAMQHSFVLSSATNSPLILRTKTNIFIINLTLRKPGCG